MQNSMEELRIVEYDDKRHHEGFRKINEQWMMPCKGA